MHHSAERWCFPMPQLGYDLSEGEPKGSGINALVKRRSRALEVQKYPRKALEQAGEVVALLCGTSHTTVLSLRRDRVTWGLREHTTACANCSANHTQNRSSRMIATGTVTPCMNGRLVPKAWCSFLCVVQHTSTAALLQESPTMALEVHPVATTHT